MSLSSLGDNIHGDEILLPVSGGYIVATLGLALLLNLIPLPGWISSATPDFVVLIVIYWSVYQAHRVGLWPAWALGLIMDVADASLFGQHAIAYCSASFAGTFLHRRIQMVPMSHQIAHVLAILMGHQFLQFMIRMVANAEPPDVLYFVSSLTGAALWPAVVGILMLPMRRRTNAKEVG
ncbi:MAG: rod shape-determining protein MreD [Betaproteobacteria bacterium]